MEYYLAAKRNEARGCAPTREPLKTLYSLNEAGHKSRIPFIGNRRTRDTSEETGSRCVADN